MRTDRSSPVPVGRLRRGVAAGVLAGLLLAACTPAEQDADVDGTRGPVAEPTTPIESDGPPLPNGSLTTFDGGTASFEDYRGTPLVVNFWASWCPPCVAEMPDFEAVHRAADGDVAFVGVNTQDVLADATSLVDETGVTYDLVQDPSGDLFREFEVFGMPSTFFVDEDGRIVGRHTGLLPREALVDALDEELGVDVGTAS